MTTNRLAQSDGLHIADKCPPDMPRGDSEADKAARQRYWIDRGNQKLIEMGKSHLHWCAKDGHYWIEEKDETSRRIEFDRRAAAGAN